MNFKVLRVVFVYLTFLVNFLNGIRWLSIRQSKLSWNFIDETNTNTSIRLNYYKNSLCRTTKDSYGFSKLQTKICKNSVDLMPSIKKAAILATDTCKSTFEHRRWNCSSVESAPNLTPDLTRATREQAYVYAISSAALTYTMAKLCSSGAFHHCSCGNYPRLPPNGNFKWGGCSDNVKWGVRFNRRFVDSTEKFNLKQSDNLHKEISQDSSFSEDLFINLKRQIAEVNLHNNRVGRRIIERSLTTQCKCHGVSGSCSIKTCWKSLPKLLEVGQKLLRRYTNAVEITSYSELKKRNLPEVPGRKSPSIDQLIFLSKSPDYCTKDVRLGSLGTKGRICNATSSGTDGCTQLCCGRGYKTVVEEKLERCQCKYYYCCYVRCKTCRIILKVHKCK